MPDFKKSHFNELMDENDIKDLIQKCRKLNKSFCCVLAANNFRCQQQVSANRLKISNANGNYAHKILLRLSFHNIKMQKTLGELVKATRMTKIWEPFQPLK